MKKKKDIGILVDKLPPATFQRITFEEINAVMDESVETISFDKESTPKEWAEATRNDDPADAE